MEGFNEGFIIGLSLIVALAFGSGFWAYADSLNNKVSMDPKRPWKESDPLAAFFGFFLLTLLLSLIGFLVAWLRYSGLRTHNKQQFQATPNVDDLIKWKQLFDSGAITEAEFNAKKKDVLGRAGQWVA